MNNAAVDDRKHLLDEVRTHLRRNYPSEYPEKNIKSWITNPTVTIEDLVKAALRNNPTWLLVSETRGQEAYEMMQGILTGHKIIVVDKPKGERK